MDAEHRFILILALLSLILLSLVTLVLFIALWSYSLIIGFVLIGLVLLLLLLVIGVTINEQVHRHWRVKHHSEQPLDSSGQPLYLYQDMKRYVEEPRYE